MRDAVAALITFKCRQMQICLSSLLAQIKESKSMKIVSSHNRYLAASVRLALEECHMVPKVTGSVLCGTVVQEHRHAAFSYRFILNPE